LCLAGGLLLSPELGVKGAALATVADFAVAAIINMVFIYKFTGFCMTFGSAAKPLLASSIMGGVIFVLLHFTESLGAWAILFAMAAAVPTYAVSLLACGGLREEDLDRIPFIGHRLLRLGCKLGLFR